MSLLHEKYSDDNLPSEYEKFFISAHRTSKCSHERYLYS